MAVASVSIPTTWAGPGEEQSPMPMPTDVGVVDTMVGFPHPDMKEVYRFITRQTKDTESK